VLSRFDAPAPVLNQRFRRGRQDHRANGSPAITTASAVPQRRTNQLDMVRE
jgi:hypothetical protein